MPSPLQSSCNVPRIQSVRYPQSGHQTGDLIARYGGSGTFEGPGDFLGLEFRARVLQGLSGTNREKPRPAVPPWFQCSRRRPDQRNRSKRCTYNSAHSARLPAQLKLQLLFTAFGLVLDRKRGARGDREARAGDLNTKRLAGLDRVG